MDSCLPADHMPPAFECMPLGSFIAKLRALASAIVFARSTCVPLFIVWLNELGVWATPYRTLFDISALPEWVNLQDAPFIPNTLWDTPPLITNPPQLEYYAQSLGEKRPIRIKASGQVVPETDALFIRALRCIQPSPTLTQAITDIFSQILGYTLVGVHIRYIPGSTATYYSPPAAFWTAMAAEPANTLFYVASDDDEMRRDAMLRFQGRVIVGYETLQPANEPDGNYQTALDFFALGRCTKIIGTYAGTFGQLAAQHAGIPWSPALAENLPTL